MRLCQTVVSFIAIIGLCLLVGCDRVQNQPSSGEGRMPAMQRAGLPAAPAPMMAEAEGGGQNSSPEADGRRIIRSMNITIEVSELATSGEKARAIAAGAGGFIADSRTFEDDTGRRKLSMTLRIPEQRFEETSKKLKELGHVREETTGGQDVTEQYVDLEARLANSQRLEERMLSLLAKQSKNLKDVLDVERELSRVRERIETMVARKRLLDNRLAMSTIELTLTEPPGWGRGIFDPLGGLLQKTLSTFTSSVAVLVVVVAALIPWIIVFFALGWIALRLLRWRLHRRRALKAKKEPPAPL